MREILFRGKRVDSGEWETGSLVYARMGTSEEQASIADKMTAYHTPVIPETVGQYTGLKDVHGTRIFEGDVVTHENYAFEVYYNNEYAGFYPFYDADNGAGYGVEAKNCEIIGNVFDSPELLEGKQ